MRSADQGCEHRIRLAANLRRRRFKEYAFRGIGAAATMVGISFLGIFLVSLLSQASSSFSRTFLALDVEFADDSESASDSYADRADFDALARAAMIRAVPNAAGSAERRELMRLVSIGASFQLRDAVLRDPSLVGQNARILVPAAADVDLYVKGEMNRSLPESQRPLSDLQIAWVDRLRESGTVVTRFNRPFFTNGDSREPELAGIRGALMGSIYMMLLTACLAVPFGVATAVYLEEFAGRNRWTDLIEVNINNLAAVPSIIFGLLGLAVFINWFGMPRSAPIVGGLVLSLLTLPVVIIAARAAISGVPNGVRLAALALGASRMQTVFHHVLPAAMPGILTGAIIGLSRALGETAPLLMIGMVAFIVDVPARITDPSTALPVQIFLWADAPERAFAQQTAAAIVVLLGFLLLMNLAAVIMRRHLERRF